MIDKTTNKIHQIGELDIEGWHRIAKAIIAPDGVCTCIHTQSNNLLQKVLVKVDDGDK